MIYQFRCAKCNMIFDVVQSMNAPHTAIHCGRIAMRIFNIPHTNRDLMYQFISDLGGKKQQIYSKRQWNRILKENNAYQPTREELKSIKPKDTKDRSRKLAKKIVDKLREKKALDWVNLKEDPSGRDKK